MAKTISKQQAWELLTAWNTDRFHLEHALTVSGVMRWFAREFGYTEDAEYWEVVGILHDIDFEKYPDEHCRRAPEILRAGGVSEDVIRAVCSHGYGIVTDIKPEHQMEKVLYAVDELTGLIGAAAIIRPSKSVQDIEVKSVKKKFKTPAFAAGCSRAVIENGAAMLGWELDVLIEKTIMAMRACEAEIIAFRAAPA